MKNYDRYSVGYFPPATPHNEWVKKDHVEKAPTWCSVDLRDCLLYTSDAADD